MANFFFSNTGLTARITWDVWDDAKNALRVVGTSNVVTYTPVIIYHQYFEPPLGNAFEIEIPAMGAFEIENIRYVFIRFYDQLDGVRLRVYVDSIILSTAPPYIQYSQEIQLNDTRPTDVGFLITPIAGEKMRIGFENLSSIELTNGMEVWVLKM